MFLDRDAQFDRVQQLHGAYWRYGFVDHSYLYNMHFPPPQMLDVFHSHLREIVTNYPVAQTELARLVANWTGANPDHLAVANGAAELIKILGSHFERRLTIPTPSFNEYEEVVSAEAINRFPSIRKPSSWTSTRSLSRRLAGNPIPRSSSRQTIRLRCRFRARRSSGLPVSSRRTGAG